MRPIRSGKDEEDKLEQHFREQLRNMQVTPPSAMWDRVEADLDDHRAKIKYDHWYLALLILLLPFTITSVVVNYNIKGLYKEFLTEKKRTESFGPRYSLAGAYPLQLRYMDKITDRAISQPLDMNYVDEAAYEARYPIAAAGKQGTAAYTASLKSKVFGNNNGFNNAKDLLFNHSGGIMDNDFALADKVEIENVNGKTPLTANNLASLDNDKSVDLPAYNKRYYKRAAHMNSSLGLPKITGFYVGVAGAGTHENMFLRYTHDPVLSKTADFNNQWGYSYGVKAGYNFSQHFGLEAEVIKSIQGSQYYYLYGGKIPVVGNISLTYIQVPLVAKYKYSKVSRITGQPVSLNILGGILYNHLNEAVITTSETKVSNTAQFFAPNQLGVIAGVEYDVFINKYIFVTLGGRGSFYTDVTKPGGKPNSYGTALGINAGVNFQIPEWRKKSDKIIIANP